jgi:hypothetical protein
VDEVKIDINQIGLTVVTLGNKVVSPHLLCQSARGARCHGETSPGKSQTAPGSVLGQEKPAWTLNEA